MIRVLSVDPGFDELGVAWWDLPPSPRLDRLDHAIGHLTGSETFRTSPQLEEEQRLERIAAAIAALLQEHRPAFVYVERPGYDGQHARTRRSAVRDAGVVKLNLGTGAVAGLLSLALPPGRLVFIRIVGTPKEERQAMVKLALQQTRKPIPAGPRGGARPDELDAIWIGAQALLARGARDVALGAETPLEVGNLNAARPRTGPEGT